MPIGPARMPIMDHLGELRMRLVRILVALAVSVVIFYFATPTVAQFLLLPIAEFLPADANGLAQLTAIDPFESFSVRFSVSFWISLVVCSPIILWQILAFFLPALKPKERKWFIPTFAAAVALFILGTVFCYFVILNPAFAWLCDQASGFATVLPRASSYVDIVIKFEIGFGCAFELPLVVFYLTVFGIVPYKKLRASWRYVYMALVVISAMVTPDASPVTMILMFAALISLYEISLLVARIALGKRLKQQEEQRKREEAEEAEMMEEWRQMREKRAAEED
jgi:sec-independent protein translocase protein TatC